MIEALKELVSMMKDVPEMALWVLGGFLFYKLFVIGSITGAIVKVLTLAINKYHEFEMKPDEHVYTVGQGIVLTSEADRELTKLLRSLAERQGVINKGSFYISRLKEEDILKLSVAYHNYKEPTKEK
jgi:hypothetical protein